MMKASVLALMAALASPAGAEPKERAAPAAPNQSHQELMRRFQRQQLEDLKRSNPEAYEAAEKERRLQEEVSRIVEDFQAGKLDAERARKKLLPLLRAIMRPELDDLDKRIARLEERLKALRKAKQDPGSLVAERADVLLGLRQSQPAPPGE